MRTTRGWSALLALVLCLTLAPALPARANTEVNWDAQAARDRMFAAYMRIHAPGTQGMRDLVLSLDALDWRRSHPSASADDITRRMALVGAELDKEAKADVYGAGAYATLMSLIRAASGVPGVNVATPVLQELLSITVGEQLAQTAAIENQVTGAYQTTMFMTAFFTEQDDFWKKVTLFGRSDSTYTAAWNGMIGGRAGIHLGASIEQLQADPLLATYIDVEALLLHQNDTNAYLRELRRQVQAATESLNTQNEQIRAQLTAMSTRYPVGPGPKPTAADYTRALAEAAHRQVALDAAGSGLFVLATLAGFADVNLGRQIATVGKAGLAIATAINNYLPTVAGLGVAQALGSMSTMALTGNILGAVMSVLPMFKSGPTPDQMILEQLQALRADVENLRTEMHGRFDAIERSLAVVYLDMIKQFDRLFLEIGEVRGQLSDIQNRLLALDTKIDSFALFTARALQEGSLAPMRQTINGKINYTGRTGEVMRYEPDYVDAESVIHTGATDWSRREPLASTSAAYTSDPITVLNRYGPGGSLSYLIWLANARYGAGLPQPGATAPSSGVFQLGGRAYTALQLQNPQHARRIGAYRSDEVSQIGVDHLNAARVLSTPTATGGPNRIFTQLLTEYRQDVGKVATDLTAVRNRVTDGRYNPFAGAGAVPSTRVTGPATLPICSGYGLSRATPVTVFRDMPNVYHNAALALPDNRKPSFSGCWSARWTDQQGEPSETWAGSLEVTVRARVQWPGSAAQEFRTVQAKRWYGNVCVYNRKTETQTCADATTEAQNGWATYKALLEQSGAVATSNQGQLAEASGRVTAALHGKARQYFETVNADLRAATPLEQSNRRLMETVALLRAYTEVAFPKALAGNPTLTSLLFGNRRIPGDYSALPGAAAPDRSSMSDAFLRAAANYGACVQDAPGLPCQIGFTPDVRHDQAMPYDGTCVGGTDHVTNCLTSLSAQRADELSAQYTRHFREIHDHAYAEGSPEVEALVDELRTVNRVIRAG